MKRKNKVLHLILRVLVVDVNRLNLSNFSGSNNQNPPSSGSIAIQIAAISSSALDWDIPAYYDLEIYSGSGAHTQVTRVIQGRVRLSKEVTLTP